MVILPDMYEVLILCAYHIIYFIYVLVRKIFGVICQII